MTWKGIYILYTRFPSSEIFSKQESNNFGLVSISSKRWDYSNHKISEIPINLPVKTEGKFTEYLLSELSLYFSFSATNIVIKYCSISYIYFMSFFTVFHILCNECLYPTEIMIKQPVLDVCSILHPTYRHRTWSKENRNKTQEN